jgi:hypothetical protein
VISIATTAAKTFELSGGLINYTESVCRIVETQEYSATLSLVSNLDEQSVLEQILDDYKPPYAYGTENRHYLISSPFRYPPLEYGSRFGSRLEPSYFYASETIECCLAEAAFYRFMLLEGTVVPCPNTITSKHDLFYVNVWSNAAVDLCNIEDSEIQNALQNPSSYQTTQHVGKYCREQSATLLRYYSARCNSGGSNVAVDNHTVIASQTPFNVTSYMCELDGKNGKVRFLAPRAFPLTYQKSMFMVNGQFPDISSAS